MSYNKLIELIFIDLLHFEIFYLLFLRKLIVYSTLIEVMILQNFQFPLCQIFFSLMHSFL